MSGHNRRSEEERELLDEQLRDYPEVLADNRERRRREEEARRQLPERLERLYLDTVERFPPQFHGLLRKFLFEEEGPASSDVWPASFRDELQRLGFLKELATNESATTTRLVYADWLDERGEHEEADRQRKWPAARQWLARFCAENSGVEGVSYEQLIEFGRRVVEAQNGSGRTYLDEDLWGALRAHSRQFWKNWSVVTGIPLPPSLKTLDFHHWACCSHEVYYWFGLPDSDELDG